MTVRRGPDGFQAGAVSAHEHTAPGVYVEKVEFRPRSICGASMSTTGFAGRTLAAIDNGGPVKLLLLGILLGSASSVVVDQSRRHYAKRLARQIADSFPTTELSTRLADDGDAVESELRSFKRPYSLAPDRTKLRALLSAGIDTAMAVAGGVVGSIFKGSRREAVDGLHSARGEERRGTVAAVTEDDAIVLLDDGTSLTVSIPDEIVIVVGMHVTVVETGGSASYRWGD